jgi:hypothetical protein
MPSKHPVTPDGRYFVVRGRVEQARSQIGKGGESSFRSSSPRTSNGTTARRSKWRGERFKTRYLTGDFGNGLETTSFRDCGPSCG